MASWTVRCEAAPGAPATLNLGGAQSHCPGQGLDGGGGPGPRRPGSRVFLQHEGAGYTVAAPAPSLPGLSLCWADLSFLLLMPVPSLCSPAAWGGVRGEESYSEVWPPAHGAGQSRTQRGRMAWTVTEQNRPVVVGGLELEPAASWRQKLWR